VNTYGEVLAEQARGELLDGEHVSRVTTDAGGGTPGEARSDWFEESCCFFSEQAPNPRPLLSSKIIARCLTRARPLAHVRPCLCTGTRFPTS